MMDDIPQPIPPGSSKLMDSLRADLRARGYALTTERTYLHWIRRFIFFHKYRHPQLMGKSEIEQFLNYLAVQAGVAPATQRIALNALMYLYVKFYGRDAEELVFNYAKPTLWSLAALSYSPDGSAKASFQSSRRDSHT